MLFEDVTEDFATSSEIILMKTIHLQMRVWEALCVRAPTQVVGCQLSDAWLPGCDHWWLRKRAVEPWLLLLPALLPND